MRLRRNPYIDISRLVCSLLVVGIHTNLGKEYSILYIGIQTITRVAVPYFLIITGYYFYSVASKQRSNETLIKYLINLGRAYIFATLPFAAVFILKNSFSISSIKVLLGKLCWGGVSAHLWYFPAVMLSLILLSVIFMNKYIQLSGKTLILIGFAIYAIPVFGDAYGNLLGITFQNTVSYSFFFRSECYALSYIIIGAGLSQIHLRFSDNIFIKTTIAGILLLYIEQYVMWHLAINTTITMAIMYPPVILLVTGKLLRMEDLRGCFGDKIGFDPKRLSELIYYYHPIAIAVFSSKITNSFLLFFIVVVVMIFTGFLLKKICNPFYKWLFR